MSASVLTQTVEHFESGRPFDADAAEGVLDALIGETDEELIAKVLTAWHRKGIEAEEIFQFARILRERMMPVRSVHDVFVDIVGTGGSKVKTFNVSTASAFVAAGAGLPVAKHGNKAATSNSGSADVLSELGVDPAPSPEAAEQNLNKIGICFMFAPNHHRLSPTLGKVRRGLGFPTIFNCVGPLCNPASARHQVIGVWDKAMVPKMAAALARLGTGRSWIVHAENGLDELAIVGKTYVTEVAGENFRTFELSADSFGLDPRWVMLQGPASSANSAAIIRSIFSNEMKDTGAEGMVVINAAAALFLAGRYDSLKDAASAAVESIRNGSAAAKLAQLEGAGRR
ncbi:MAG: anthranilate phosphoribosyltransferase [Pyrinomonadaceae bacterium]